LKSPHCLALFICLVLQLAIASKLSAQNYFSTVVNGKPRSYLVVRPKGEGLNQPMLIVLRSGTIKSLEQNATDSIWQSLTTSSTLVFPVASGGKWNCEGSEKENNDILFLSTLILEVYGSFHINRNKVYLIDDENGQCLTEKFYSKSTKSLSARPFGATNKLAVAKVNSFFEKEDNQQLEYELYKKTKLYLGDEKKERDDSIKMNKWEKRLTWEDFH
jgi:poly(3-hydroxybutyrate) depolymerase